MDDHGWAERRAIVIAGPTASGKSAVALALAEHLGGTVINADSMQVYADLTILTARPGVEETARVPHRLFGHVDAADAYSVGRWLADVEGVLLAVWAERRVPVLVGGSGLYLKALTQGLSDIPPVPTALRTRLREEAEVQSPAQLHARLAAIDPDAAARLRPTDPQRILRALEVFEATGRSLTTFQAERGPPILPASACAGVVLAPARAVLNERIDLRFDAMIAAGALDEVAGLAGRGLDPALPAMRALGVAPLIAALRGAISAEAAIARGKLLTRQYAKRQATFARHQLADFTATSPEQAFTMALAQWRVLTAS